MKKQQLLIFPCSARKEWEALPKPLPPAFIQDFIGRKTAQKLVATRDRVFKDREVASLDRRSSLTTALALYSGNQYRAAGFKDRVAEAIRSGVHCLIISGGYGLIRAEEPIHKYGAAITSTRKYWKDIIPEVLADYIQRNHIGRVFVACSSSYATILMREDWSGNAEVFWRLPRLRKGQGGAQVKVPRLTGEAVVELVNSDFRPDNRWKRRWPE